MLAIVTCAVANACPWLVANFSYVAINDCQYVVLS